MLLQKASSHPNRHRPRVHCAANFCTIFWSSKSLSCSLITTTTSFCNEIFSFWRNICKTDDVRFCWVRSENNLRTFPRIVQIEIHTGIIVQVGFQHNHFLTPASTSRGRNAGESFENCESLISWCKASNEELNIFPSR